MLIRKLILVVLLKFCCKLNTVLAASVETLIVNGKDAAPGQFKHAVSLQFRGSHFCGGSIIKPNWILTAGHCGNAVSNYNLRSIRVMVGSVTLNPSGDYYDVAKIIIHENFQQARTYVINDVGLFKLKTDIKFNRNSIASIPIARSAPQAGSMARVSGWGYNDKNSVPNRLQYLDVKLITKRECSILNAPVSNLDGQICSVADRNKGVCNGDSGAALVYRGEQIGIVSWGLQCASGKADVYAEVPNFSGWISNKIANN